MGVAVPGVFQEGGRVAGTKRRLSPIFDEDEFAAGMNANSILVGMRMAVARPFAANEAGVRTQLEGVPSDRCKSSDSH